MSEDFPITIYHNPACGTSRNTLAMVQAAGYEPTVVEYLKVGWTRPLLDDLLAKTGLKPRDLIRENPSINAIKSEARKNGMIYLQEDGLRQVIQGKTSIDELLRVVK